VYLLAIMVVTISFRYYVIHTVIKNSIEDGELVTSCLLIVDFMITGGMKFYDRCLKHNVKKDKMRRYNIERYNHIN